MLKLITYPMIMFIALFVTVPVKYPAVNTKRDFTASSSDVMFGNSPFFKTANSTIEKKFDCYQEWDLGNVGLSENAFNYAMKGFDYLCKSNLVGRKDIVSIVDFSKPSSQKRLYVIDVSSGKILFNTWVAHGKNSGNEYAKRFSNSPESHQSSLGFYTTLETYFGEHGYSLRLKGCEKGINDKAYERAIVIHGADYVCSRYINYRGIPGRSYGCPAIPNELSKKIIDVIKNGSCLFIYHPTKTYTTKSKILNSQI